jgi:hypothetical protein
MAYFLPRIGLKITAMTMTKLTTSLCLLSSLALAACSGGNDVKEKLGLKASPPDEFSVVTRAPLSVPPDYTLRPPRPGADRPMEISVREQAKQTVFGASDVDQKAKASAETAQGGFMNKLGATDTSGSIRNTLDAEMTELDKSEQPAAEKLLFWKDKEPKGKTLDPVEEQKRLEATGASKPKLKDSKSSVEKRNEDILESQ